VLHEGRSRGSRSGPTAGATARAPAPPG
jgi:hypothetical protein